MANKNDGDGAVLDDTFSSVVVDGDLRTIYASGIVTPKMAWELEAALRKLEENGPGPVRIYSNSIGGDFAAGMAMHDSLYLSPLETVFEGFGEICSSMSAVMQGATKRRLAPNCTVMVHNGSIALAENPQFDEAQRVVREGNRANLQYYRTLARRSKLSIAELTRACERETWFSAEEAVRVGLADEVIAPKPRKSNRKRSGRC